MLKSLFHDFLSKTFCLTVPRNFLCEAFRIVFHKVSGSEKFIDEKGGREYQDSSSEFFCLTVPKTFGRETFLWFKELLLSINLLDKPGGGGKEGSIKYFCLSFFV